MHEVKPVTSGYRVSLTFHLWLSEIYGQIPRSIKRARLSPSPSACTFSQLREVVKRALMYWLEKNEFTEDIKFIIVLDHQYSSESLEIQDEGDIKRCFRGRDRLLFEALDSFYNDLYVDVQLLTVDRFEKRKPEENLDRITIPVMYGDSYASTESDQPPENLIWLNRHRFLSLEHDLFSYRYDTGNEGAVESLAYKPCCITIYHPDYEGEEFY